MLKALACISVRTGGVCVSEEQYGLFSPGKQMALTVRLSPL